MISMRTCLRFAAIVAVLLAVPGAAAPSDPTGPQWRRSARRTSSRSWSRRTRYTELIYEPMLEVMRSLRANGYGTYIVTGGGKSSCERTPTRPAASNPTSWTVISMRRDWKRVFEFER